MESFLHFIQTHAPFLVTYKYLFLFIGGMLEGLNSLVLAGFIASTGQVKLYIIIPLLIVAHSINGYMWYAVGYFGGAKSLDKWGHRHHLSHNIINTIQSYFGKYSARAIMFAKFTFTLEIATLILSGSLKYDLKQFSKYNFLGSVGWVSMAVLVGYFFGESFQLFSSLLKNFTLLLVFLAGAIALIYIIKIIIKRYFVRYILIQQKFREWAEKVREELDGFLSNGDE
ncbi:MAG: DedA family protein [bacterium]|nr:DedA family protein [bacterium]